MSKKLVITYNIIATLLIIAMVIYISMLQKELEETEEVLNQCEEVFYEKIK